MPRAPDTAATKRIKPDEVASDHRTAILLLILACLFWGISFPVSKSLTLLYLQSMPGSSSWFAVSLQGNIRFLMAGLLMVPFACENSVASGEAKSFRGLVSDFAAVRECSFKWMASLTPPLRYPRSSPKLILLANLLLQIRRRQAISPVAEVRTPAAGFQKPSS
jgi:hypothetical protein